TPLTFLPGQLKKHKFPLLIKPRCGQGSQQVFKLNNQKEYDFFTAYIDDPIIQEYIEGTEFTIDTVSDLTGRLIAAVPRKRIEVRGGEVSKAVTVKEERLINWTKEIIEGMKMIGPANLQAIITPEDEIKFIELNPRFGGGVPLSYQAGVNYPKIITSLIKKEEVKPFLGEFEDGLAMLRYDCPLFKKIGV
ncbi:MAG: ATP-grasp domain-containing protein, partial [Halanaerobiales bacterium]|nr:ATP-grasp domain-containing protein [Halanaerobiales bacterium]